MQRPNPVRPISQQRHQIQAGPPPQQAIWQAPQQPSPEQQIQSQMHELALEIYARIAADHLADDHYTRPLSTEHLHQLASHSQLAARCYFEALGIKFDEQPGVS